MRPVDFRAEYAVGRGAAFEQSAQVILVTSGTKSRNHPKHDVVKIEIFRRRAEESRLPEVVAE